MCTLTSVVYRNTGVTTLLGSLVWPVHPPCHPFSLSLWQVWSFRFYACPSFASTAALLPHLVLSVSSWSMPMRWVDSWSKGWGSNCRGFSIPLWIFLSYLLLLLKSRKSREHASPPTQPLLCIPELPSSQSCGLDQLGFQVEREQLPVRVSPETVPLISIRAFFLF